MSHIVRFDCFELDLAAGRLLKHGTRIGLPTQSVEVLASLVEQPGQVVTREDLRRRLWHDDVFVDFDNNLNTAIARLREALCDSAARPRFIETLPKRGYRFIADVSAVPCADAAQPRRPRLLVLPFMNTSGDPAQEYFSDAMTDEIITELASLAPEQLAVIARTTAMHYKGSRKDVASIGRELSVDYVVEGGVRRADSQVAVNVQLIQVSDQTHLFARKYEAEMREVFNLHDCVARAIARHIPAVAEGVGGGMVLREQVRRKPTEDIAAYNEFIKGRFEMWKMTAEGTTKGKQHFEAALARDPNFALACNALAELYWYLGFWGYAPSQQTDAAGLSYILRALRADPTLAETHALLSFYPKQRQAGDGFDYYDWAAMQKDLAHARELDPSSRLVRVRCAIVLMILGHIDEAAAEVEKALESDPLSLDVRCWLVTMLWLGRQYDRALEQALQLVEMEPEHYASHFVVGQAYIAMQRFEESTAALRKAAELSHEMPLVLAWLGMSLGFGGHTAEARAVLDRLRAMAGQRYVLPTCFAWTHLALGEIDEAFVWMDRAIDAPDRMMKPIKTYPFLDPLRSDPRFAALLRKMNLEN